jgi:hypothetical protein
MTHSRGGIKFLFGVIFITNLLINVDHGILPACTGELRNDLGFSTINIGILGSLVYLGLVLGNNHFSFISQFCLNFHK